MRKEVTNFCGFSKVDWLVYITSVIIVTLISLGIADNLSLNFETLTLTGLDSGNENALSHEVGLKSIDVDGKNVRIEPTIGKWYWRGNDYLWKPTSDINQPAELTTSVSFKIPVGHNRSLKMVSYRWSGEVSVIVSNKGGNTIETQVIDTYSNIDWSEMSVKLSASPKTTLAKERISVVAIAIFLFIVALTFLMSLYFIVKKYKDFFYRYSFTFIIIGIALIAFYIMRVALAANLKNVLWYDYMLSLQFIRTNSLWDAIVHGISTDGNGPLYAVLLFIWYRLMPTGNYPLLLLLLSEFFSAFSIVLIGLTGKKLFGYRCGIICTIVALGATVILRYGSALRSYSLVVCLSTILLYLHANGHIKGVSRKYLVLFGICLASIVYAHVFALLLCFGFFVIDVIISMRRKNFQRIWSYIIALCLYAPYGVLFFLSPDHMTPGGSNPNSATNILSMILALFDGNRLYLVFFELGACLLLFEYLSIKTNPLMIMPETNKLMLTYMILSLVVVQLMFCISFAFERFTNSGFTYLYRYVIAVVPILLIVIGYFLEQLFVLIETVTTDAKRRPIVLAISVVCFLSVVSASYTQILTEPLELNNNALGYEARLLSESAAYIQSADLFMPSTAVYYNMWWERQVDGITQWAEFLVGDDGKRDIPNFVYVLDVNMLVFDNLITIDYPGYALTEAQHNFISIYYNENTDYKYVGEHRIITWERKDRTDR